MYIVEEVKFYAYMQKKQHFFCVISIMAYFAINLVVDKSTLDLVESESIDGIWIDLLVDFSLYRSKAKSIVFTHLTAIFLAIERINI